MIEFYFLLCFIFIIIIVIVVVLLLVVYFLGFVVVFFVVQYQLNEVVVFGSDVFFGFQVCGLVKKEGIVDEGFFCLVIYGQGVAGLEYYIGMFVCFDVVYVFIQVQEFGRVQGYKFQGVFFGYVIEKYGFGSFLIEVVGYFGIV